MTEQRDLTVPTAAASRLASEGLIAAALNAAVDIGLEISVSIVDAGGTLKGFCRTDGAPFLTSDAAIDKAWTAASFGYATHVWNDYIADPKLAPLSQTPRFVAVGGGYPLKLEGKLVGGMGISGGTYLQDQAIAEAAITSLGFDIA